MNLCRFFAGVSGAIEAVVKFTVTPFLESIQSATTGGAGKKVGMYALTDMTRTVSVSYSPWLAPVKRSGPGVLAEHAISLLGFYADLGPSP
jgi:hypothetical protein